MEKQTIFAMFPGQGSQRVGMGLDLDDPIAHHYFEMADRVLKIPLSKFCFGGPQETLTRTDIAQPAILTVSLISFEMAKRAQGDSFRVVCASGHSLGEYSALVAAGALSFEDAVVLVHKRGRYMQEAVPVGIGKMVAILGKELLEIEEAVAKVSTGVASIANVNAPGQVVVAGDVTGVDEFLSHLPGAKAKQLEVSAPFHCALMKPAEVRLTADLSAISISPCEFPVITNVSAAPQSNPDTIRRHLSEQVCGRVRWVECVERASHEFLPQRAVEFGVGNVLTGLLKRIAPELPKANVYSSSDAESL